MQILISLFIEGGTPLELEDQEWTLARWQVYFVYAFRIFWIQRDSNGI